MAESEMVERVARALCRANEMEPDQLVGADPIFIDEANWTYYIDDARAAIEAMREPTEAMLKSVCGVEQLADYTRQTDGVADSTWRTMIDTALNSP